MKTLNILLLATLLFCFTGCEEKSVNNDQKLSQEEEQNNTIPEKYLNKTFTFQLSDIQEHNLSLTLMNKEIKIDTVSKKLIIINFFATWCAPCKGEIPYLADLQEKYKDSLFLAGILLNDDIAKEDLQTFIKTYGINYFISSSKENDAFAHLAVERLQLPEDFPIPITVLFKEGHYYSHYIGAVPIEMLEHDIKNALHKE